MTKNKISDLILYKSSYLLDIILGKTLDIILRKYYIIYNNKMRKEILFWVFLASVVYSLIFAYMSSDKKNLQYFFVLCSILQILGAYSIHINNIQSLEIIHALMFIFCFIITLCIQSNIANLYTFFIIIVILLTRLWFKGCLFYEIDEGKDAQYFTSQQMNTYIILFAVILLNKILYFTN